MYIYHRGMLSIEEKYGYVSPMAPKAYHIDNVDTVSTHSGRQRRDVKSPHKGV